MHAPSGLAPWPTVLLAGIHKSGKSWCAAEFTGDPLIGQSFWIECGETSAEEYGNVPGADYVIVEHDGSYRGILAAVKEAVAEPRQEDARPNLLVFDSGTQLWELLSDEAQAIANARLDARNEKYRRAKRDEEDDATITPDLWNRAKRRWYDVIDLLIDHDGPAVICCRMEEQVVMVDEKPTKDRIWKVIAHKRLPFDVTAVCEFRTYRTATVTGVRSVRWTEQETGSVTVKRFRLTDLMAKLGITGQEGMGPAGRTPLHPEAAVPEQLAADAEEAKKAASAESFDNASPTRPEPPAAAPDPAPPAPEPPPATDAPPTAAPDAHDDPVATMPSNDWAASWLVSLADAVEKGELGRVRVLAEQAKQAGRSDLVVQARTAWSAVSSSRRTA
jgi:hypothetical protein